MTEKRQADPILATKEMVEQLQENPYNTETHLTYIDALRKEKGDVLSAWEFMSQCVFLTKGGSFSMLFVNNNQTCGFSG